jgi:nucleotide-binding universal stress UspA family protein
MFVAITKKFVNTDITKGILCAIDFSESSKEVLNWSVSLAKMLRTQLTVLYTYRLLNSTNGEATELKKKIEENAERNFAVFEKEFLTDQGIHYDFKVEVGFVSNRIKDYAKKNGLSFVVIGRTNNSSSRESFDELAEDVHVPLVIIP